MSEERDIPPRPETLNYAGPRPPRRYPPPDDERHVSRLAAWAFVLSIVSFPCITGTAVAFLTNGNKTAVLGAVYSMPWIALCLGITAYVKLIHADRSITGNGLAASSICISSAWILGCGILHSL